MFQRCVVYVAYGERARQRLSAAREGVWQGIDVMRGMRVQRGRYVVG
jgi:hypothetical protein